MFGNVRRTSSGQKKKSHYNNKEGTSTATAATTTGSSNTFMTIDIGSSSLSSSSTTTTSSTDLQNDNNNKKSFLHKDILEEIEEETLNIHNSNTMMKPENHSGDGNATDDGLEMKPLVGGGGVSKNDTTHTNVGQLDYFISLYCPSNPDFFKQALKLLFAFIGLQISYLTWGYMQELIMTTKFTPTEHVPDGKFPSAAFCVFSNRFLAVIIALIAVRIKHGAFFSNNVAPLYSFTPCALSNTMSSWSQYASLKYVSFPVQTVFKSSKIIPVMIMGKVLKGTQYPWNQYIEAALITIGVALFSVLSKSSSGHDTQTELIGLLYLITYVCFDSFTSQWQDKVYQEYGRENVDPYQMMLGVNVSAIIITSIGLVFSGDIPIVYEFLLANPEVFHYNVITAITSASGQLCIFYTIKEFGPIVFTVIMTTRQMLSICLSAIMFGHVIKLAAACGAGLVFGVLFYQIYNKYKSKSNKPSRG